jgi:Neuraminidase (sialidase)
VEQIGDKRHALRTAARDVSGWAEARTVAQGENWFVNWADFPSVIALRDGSLAAHWLVKSGTGTYAYNVNIARSKDGGKTWSKPIVPHLDGTKPSMVLSRCYRSLMDAWAQCGWMVVISKA